VAGHVFRLFDEKNQQLRSGSIWLKGQSYDLDDQGEVCYSHCLPSWQSHLLQSFAAGDCMTDWYHASDVLCVCL